MPKLDFVSQDHWDEGYAELSPTASDIDDPIRQTLLRYLPKGSLSCFEMGCYPGRYLAVLGELGYELNGCDLTPKVEHLGSWLRQNGYIIGEFIKHDVFDLDESIQYDVVASFGLIEHFGNWEELFFKHISLVAPKGYLVVTTPNFRSPLQYTLHKILDVENLKIHNIKSMDPDKWANLAKSAGFEVLFKGGIGRFEFWAGSQERNLIQKVLLRAIRATKFLWRFVPVGTMSMSPYYGLIARRK